ncbi:MAG: hypothetical protein ACLR3S_04410 [Clostridium fessum]
MKLFQRDEAYGMMVRDLKTAQSVSYAVPAVLEKTLRNTRRSDIRGCGRWRGIISVGSWQMIWDWEKRCR